MELKRIIEIVDGILGNDSLCKGCTVVGPTPHGSCAECCRDAADEIIEMIKSVCATSGVDE